MNFRFSFIGVSIGGVAIASVYLYRRRQALLKEKRALEAKLEELYELRRKRILMWIKIGLATSVLIYGSFKVSRLLQILGSERTLAEL